MPLGETLPPVRKRDVKLHDQMAVARLVQGPARALAPLHHTRERERSELALGVALLDAGPDGSPLRSVLSEGEGVEKTQPSGIGDPLERRRGALVLFVAGALQKSRVAREEVQVPVFDRHLATAQTRPTTPLS